MRHQFLFIGQGQILLAWHKFLSGHRPDWLFWECADPLWGALVEIARISRVRTIFHTGFDTDVVPRTALRLELRRRWWPLYAWGLSRTDCIFVQHNGQLSGLKRPWQAKASVLPKVCMLPQGLGDVSVVKPHGDREEYVAWVAMLRQHKRPDVLVEIARRMPHVRFVVCGGRTTYVTSAGFGDRVVNALRALPNVNYRGQVEPDEAMAVIAGAAVFLSTSDGEGFPNTFTQAWSAGTPVVSLHLDPDHLIKRIGMGRVVDNVDGAIASIDDLINVPQRREAIAARARRFISDKYSATAVVRLFEQALNSTHR